MKKGYYFAIILLVIAAVCMSLNTPLSALLLQDASPFMAGAFMALGALIWGVISLGIGKKSPAKEPDRPFQRKDIKWLAILCISSILCDALLYFGLTMCPASSAALVSNFAIVMTAIFAMILLKEKISKRLWIAIALITLGGITISAGNLDALASSPGILLIFGYCICSGIFYCCMKKLAGTSPGKVLIIYQSIALVCELILAFIFGEAFPDIKTILLFIALGMVVFGIANYLFMIATRTLGAAKCSSVIGLAPFLAAGLSLVIFQEQPSLAFFISLILLIPGFYLVIRDNDEKEKLSSLQNAGAPVERYHDVRNYLTAAGLLAVFAIVVIGFIETLQDYMHGTVTTITAAAGIGITILLILIGCILLVLRRRDFAAIVMLLSGFLMVVIICTGENSWYYQGVLGLMMLIMAGIMFLAKEKKKYWHSILILIIGAECLVFSNVENDIPLMIIQLITCAYLLVMVIGSSGLAPRFPPTKILVEDETLSFEKVGVFLCYFIVAASILPWMGTYLFGTEIVSLESLGNFSIGCALMITIIATLLIFVGKKRFTGAVFIGVALFLLLAGSTSDMINYVAGIVMLLVGLACFLRKKSYLLLGLMCILYGISTFTSVIIHGETVLLVSQFLMHSVTFALAVYLALAVFSQSKKLPLF